MHRRPGSSSIAAAIIAWASGASAQAGEVKPYPECVGEPTEGDVSAAKGAFQAGQASFNEADYERAIVYWEDAFRRDCTAVALLRNLALAYELSGKQHQAVEALQTYLARNPDSDQTDQITRRIDLLNQQIEKERAAAAQANEPTPEPPKSAIAPESPPPPADDAGGASMVHWVGPGVMAGAGLILIPVGAVVHSAGSADVEQAERDCPDRTGCPAGVAALGNQGRNRQRLGVGLMVGGLALVGGAAAWFFVAAPYATESAWHRPAEPERQLAFTPVVSPSYSGLSLSGSF